jgi:hypothetical protein
MLALTACGRAEKDNADQVSHQAQPTMVAPGTGPDAKTPLAPVKPAIDPKSPEAAVDVVADFANLLKQRRYREAHRLWSGDPTGDGKFAAKFSGYEIEGAAIGKPGPQEGAAGSIYVAVPLQLFFANGDYTGSLTGPMTLRRVNDVPGSTEEQRRWHIVKADLQPAD